ncbi:MAG: aminopeptidase P family protein [Bacteroidetes bacterium]|nr:aminopeptidase P family protein [Bacteroidota bacterium]
MKLEFIRKKLDEHQADAYILINHEYSAQPDSRYLAGFSGSESIILVTKSNQYLLVDGRYTIRGAQESPNYEMMVVNRGKVYDDLATILPKLAINTVLIDADITSYSSVLALKNSVSGLNVKTVNHLLIDIRISKTDDEIEKLKQAGSIACQAFNQLVSEIKPGVTEKWVAGRLEFLMKDMGADKYSFDTIVASGTNGAFPHYVPSTKELRNGELVTIDWGCYLNGYASDMTRTIAIGQISDKLRDIYETVKGSQQAGLDHAKHGISGINLDKVCRNYITERNYGEYFVHGTGHGLGLDVHEYPMVNTTNNEVLPLNSVVSIEPGIYIQDVGGVRIEDCVVIQENGHINLNDQVTKELITIS